jgi:hypothetical protein
MQRWAFYLLLCIPILAWASVVLPTYFLNTLDIAVGLVYAIVTVSPVVGGDFSIFGELTPIVLAGSIIALMPKSQNEINYFAVLLAIVSYLLFIHLSVFFSSGPGVGLLSVNWNQIAGPQKTILNLVSNVRVMAIIVGASLLGFKVKSTA